ncbi:IS4/Tn5 family transposase DNA-binding protein [Aromatoleum anaerobium]|uniref:IS4/Tn5 family transposase DNA-binding protein n=1 Tax=Aromatoleum anaerobium TaxID=182180 RepID=UPI003CCFE1B3
MTPTRWAAEEFEILDLGDQRLSRRAVLQAERLAAQPTASIPVACGGWAETQKSARRRRTPHRSAWPGRRRLPPQGTSAA